MEKIFIPTFNRIENQITYDGLPPELQRITTLVVQHDEAPKYPTKYDLMVLPEEINYLDYFCIAKTRKYIYDQAQNMKYAVLDDDIVFMRRNAKYWNGGHSTMEKSKRICTQPDILEMFQLYSNWLDDGMITVVGCSHVENPPQRKAYVDNASLGSAYWINGPKFKDDLPFMDLTCVKCMEDTNFLLHLLTRGYTNRVSQEFAFKNMSVHTKKMKSEIWDNQSFDDTHRDHRIIENQFPNFFKILYTDDGKRIDGGFRNYGKVKVSWSKAAEYGKNYRENNTLNDFLKFD